LRLQLNNASCQTDDTTANLSKQLINLEERENELADIQERLTGELHDYRAARTKLDIERAAFLR